MIVSAGEPPHGSGGLLQRARDMLVSRAVLLLLLLAFVAVALIGVVGIGASVVVVESVRGSASAINAAGSLRRLVQRAGGLAVARALDSGAQEDPVAEAVAQFEIALAHPALIEVLEREPSSVFSAIFRGVEAGWRVRMKPRLLDMPAWPESDPQAYYAALLGEVDTYAEQINTLVAVLETDAESRIQQLRTLLAAALLLLLAFVIAALYALHRRVLQPLTDLRACAVRIAGKDFDARARHTGTDELGRVGEAFNAMAGELSAVYRDLAARVDQKTADLMRSNRALELLYYVISRLYHAPASSETYAETLNDLERTLGLSGSFMCIEPKHGGAATVLSSTFGECAQRAATGEECVYCPGRQAPWTYRREGAMDVLLVPLRNSEQQFGMLRLALPAGRRLQDWEQALLNAVSRHMGIALGISHQSERDRLLALQEERSIIARELHDSLAQSLSYMKIQVSLLTPALAGPQPCEQAQPIVADLREGINAAYRQLRELLATFRLHMEGDFPRLLSSAVDEYVGRSGTPIDLDIRLGHCSLSPNQEIHVLHIVREALANATRHADASRIQVTLRCDADGEVSVEITDDGKGVGAVVLAEPHHFGLSIMAERARGLGGELEILPRPGGGTRIVVCFHPRAAGVQATLPALTDAP